MKTNKSEDTFDLVNSKIEDIKAFAIDAINQLGALQIEDGDMFTKLRRWEALSRIQGSLKMVTEPEMTARKDCMAAAFANPKEGTNTLELGNGWKLKGVRKIDRKLNEDALPVVKEALAKSGVLVDRLIEYKPSLSITEYRELTAEQVAILNEALTEKDGAPSLELVPPKARA